MFSNPYCKTIENSNDEMDVDQKDILKNEEGIRSFQFNFDFYYPNSN